MPRVCKVVAEMVPVSLDPSRAEVRRVLETAHGLPPGSIVDMGWLKSPARRRPGQTVAFLGISIKEEAAANKAIRGMTIEDRRVWVRRDANDPVRCLKCQSYGGHIMQDCPQCHDTCANCGEDHRTSDCEVGDRGRFRCVNCGGAGHAAWDRDCPAY